MKLKVRLVGIETGFTPVVTINHLDAIRYDLHPRDRVTVETIGKGKRKVIAAVDVISTDKSIKQGEVGVLVEVTEELSLKEGDIVDIHPAPKPDSLKYIKRKMDGEALSARELDRIVKDIVAGSLSEVELSFFVAAVVMNPLSLEEITGLTRALTRNGSRFSTKKRPVVDKHCIGGIPGNRTTMIVVPILAAFGLTLPKTSSRAITSPAGTADTMETLADVELSLEKMEKVVAETGACIAWGGSLGLAPADDRIIRIEKPMSIDASGLMLSSVMAKKFSVGATHILIDIPYGRSAKVSSRFKAEELKQHFLSLGTLLGMKLTVMLTDGNQPIGNGIGPVLETRDVLAVLQNKPDAPQDFKEKSLRLAAELLEFAGGLSKRASYEVAKDVLESGSAWKKMQEIIAAQGPPKEQFKLGHLRTKLLATHAGTVKSIDNKAISKLARLAGAPITKGAGLYLHKKVGDKVKKGEPLYTAYADSTEKIRHVKLYHEELKPYRVK
ncbi:AMP phosphorylase [Candidatus Woesearchaeota archaeon]|nr:AMP phosphorylase [Candidatus Woesearchaeota archaeon]